MRLGFMAGDRYVDTYITIKLRLNYLKVMDKHSKYNDFFYLIEYVNFKLILKEYIYFWRN